MRSTLLKTSKGFIIVLILVGHSIAINGSAVCGGIPGRESSSQDGGIEETVRQLLESPRPQDRAWGAYLIGNDGLKSLSPRLIKLLEGADRENSFEERLVLQCALDSLIQLKQPVSAKLVNRLFGSFPNETLILAALDPHETQGALLGLIMQDRTDFQWFAIANILSKEKTPGFAALMARGLEIKVSVDVVDSDGIGSGSGAGFGCSIGCGAGPPLLEGFPPIGMYRIDDKPDHSDGLVSDGRHPIYFQRKLVRAGEFFGNNSGCENHFSRNENKLGYLADMLGVKDSEIGISLSNYSTIEWKSAEQYRRQMANIENQMESRFADFVVRLVMNGLVTIDDAATLRPNLLFTVHDLRNDTSVKLPKIASQVSKR